MSKELDIKLQPSNGTLIAYITGRLDITRSEEFELEVIKNLRKQPRDLILNMFNVTYMSSSGIRALLTIFREVGDLNKKMLICNLPASVRRVMDVVDIGQIFQIFNSEEEAVQALSASR